jgi:hypothetical protein
MNEELQNQKVSLPNAVTVLVSDFALSNSF